MAVTKEHCPPRSLFQNREWPEGFEFPACNACNHGTSDQDVLIAFLGRIDPFQGTGNLDGKTNGLMRNAHAQHPGLLREMFSMSPTESRKAARKLGIKPPLGLTYQQAGIATVTEHMNQAVQTLARKLSKAIYYLETGSIFPPDGDLLFHWFSNADLLRDGSIAALEAFAPIQASKRALVRNKKDLSGQFDYRYSLSDDRELALLQAVFGRSFGFVTTASPVPGKLRSMEAAIKEKTGIEGGPFMFI